MKLKDWMLINFKFNYGKAKQFHVQTRIISYLTKLLQKWHLSFVNHNWRKQTTKKLVKKPSSKPVAKWH